MRKAGSSAGWLLQAPDPVPALLLGRLAVDKDFAGLGVCTALVAYVLATAIELNAKAACRAVVVSALNPRARSWWERLGFHAFHPDDPTETDLYRRPLRNDLSTEGAVS